MSEFSLKSHVESRRELLLIAHYNASKELEQAESHARLMKSRLAEIDGALRELEAVSTAEKSEAGKPEEEEPEGA